MLNMNQPQEYCRQVPNLPKPGPQMHIARMTEAVIWNMVLQLSLLFLFILFSNLNPLHPLTWIGNSFATFVSSWFKIIVLIFVIYIQGEVCKEDYVTGKVYHSSKFQKMRHVFGVRNMLLLLFYMIIGITTFWIYTSIPGSAFESFTRPCTPSYQLQDCLVEGKVFLLLGGLWSSIYYFTKDYLFSSRSLLFPLIQQRKFYRVKAALIQTFLQSLKDSILPSGLFIIIYFFCGGYIRSRSMELLSVTTTTNKVPIDTIQGILNIQLIVCLWIFASLFIVSLKMMELLFNIYLTEHYEFPITINMLPPGNYVSLMEALKGFKVPIIHHLGYLDLFSLATQSIHRRREVFTLSHPGGHPHSWNEIVQESTILIKTFTTDLSKALQKASNVDSTKFKRTEPKLETSSFHFHSHNMRKLASPVSNTVNAAANVTWPNEYQSAVEIAFNSFQNWLNLKIEWFYKKPYISFFFAESTSSCINHLLCQSQPIIWAVQGLSFLSAASLTEDRYGIVQKDLSEIIITIVGLKQVLDKLFKQNLIVKKSFANDPLEVQMKYLLKTSVKRSLYKISVTFGPYIKDLRLPVEVEVQMNNFNAFKEVL